jgi:hypothetical protein
VATANRLDEAKMGGTGRLTSEQVWRAIAGASFAVVSYVTPAGEPRSSGVVYAAARARVPVGAPAGRERQG